MPRRTISWSSSRKTRIGVGASVMTPRYRATPRPRRAGPSVLEGRGPSSLLPTPVRHGAAVDSRPWLRTRGGRLRRRTVDVAARAWPRSDRSVLAGPGPAASTTPSPGRGGCGPTAWTCTPTTSAACRWRTPRVASSCSAAAPPCTTPRWPPGRSAGSRPCAGSRTRRRRRCWPRYGSRRPCHRARPPPTSGPCTSAARTGAASRRGRCPTSGSSDSLPRPASGTPTPLPSPTSPTVSGSTCWWDGPTSCRPVIPTCSPSKSSGSTGTGVTASRPRPCPTGPHRTRATAAASGWARSRTPVATSRAPTA